MRNARLLMLTALALTAGAVVYLRVPDPSPAGSLDAEEDTEARERGVHLGTVPEPVRAVILAELGDHQLGEIEEVISFDGELFYEAEWIEGGMEVEIAVAPDGSILGREIEELDGDEGEVDDD